jgi:hypothetical protein
MTKLLPLLFLSLGTVAAAALDRFPVVPSNEATPYPRGLEVSPRYRVWVKPAADAAAWRAETHATATYRLWPDYLDPDTLPGKHAGTSVHVAQVDSDERVRVRVELIDGEVIDTLRLKPTRLRELEATMKRGDTWVEFEIEPYRYTRSVLVEINAPAFDGDALQDGLMVFLNPLSVMPVGRVLRLPAGVITADSPWLDELNRLLVTAESPYDALYVPRDTIIDGRVDVRKPGFLVAGRGMIVGSRWPFAKAVPDWRKRYPEWISPDGEWVRPILAYNAPHGQAENTTRFEGVLVAHPYHFCVGGAGWNENLKTFGWRYSSDGVHGEHKRGCFVRVNDDAMYVNQGSIEDCVYWGMVNGAVFQFGWGGNRDSTTPVRVRRCDVLRGEWDNLPNPGQDGLGSPEGWTPPVGPSVAANRGVWTATFRSAEALTVRHKYFEDIRVDAQVNRLFYFGSRTEKVSYEDFVLKDVWFETVPHYQGGIENVLRGKETVRGFVFENFVVGGRRAESLEDFAPLDQRNVEGVEFR